MREFQERRFFRKNFFSRPVFVLILALAILLGFSVEKVYRKSQQAILRNKAVEDELEALQEREEGLRMSIRQLQTPDGVEEELRRKFQIKKPGEEFVVIIDEEVPAKDADESKTEAGFLKKIWNFFKNIF